MTTSTKRPLQFASKNGQELQGKRIDRHLQILFNWLIISQGKGRRGGGGGGRGGGGGGGGARDSSWRSYPAIVKEHQNLQRFYDTLLQLPDEEKQQYWDALRRELPNSFRFCGSKGLVARSLAHDLVPSANLSLDMRSLSRDSYNRDISPRSTRSSLKMVDRSSPLSLCRGTPKAWPGG